jgi:hypothetical protein
LIPFRDAQNPSLHMPEGRRGDDRRRGNLAVSQRPERFNIRIAPTYPPMDDLIKAAQLFSLCVKLVSVEKLLGEERTAE